MDYVKALQDMCLELVNNRDKLEVREMPSLDDNAIVLYVYASHDDISKLIGRKGVMANSIRQLMSVAGRLSDKKLDIKFNDKDTKKKFDNYVKTTYGGDQ